MYCCECRAAGLKNDFACGKPHPPKGWKKEYLRRHAESSNHAKHGSLAISTAKTAVFVFRVPKFYALEAQTIGLLVNIHFLVTNGLFMNKGAALHALMDLQLAFYDDEDMEIVSIFLISTSQSLLPMFLESTLHNDATCVPFLISLLMSLLQILTSVGFSIFIVKPGTRWTAAGVCLVSYNCFGPQMSVCVWCVCLCLCVRPQGYE